MLMSQLLSPLGGILNNLLMSDKWNNFENTGVIPLITSIFMSTEPIRCLEFFSGIGGLHYALIIAKINATVVQAFDVNIVANKVYKHNFHHTPSTKSIDKLSLKELNAYNAQCWLLSPPCQPYTRGGNQKDIDDPRAKPLSHLIDLLPQLDNCPEYVFLENVRNFESSKSREKLVDTLEELGYMVKECLLSPTQFGIPNTRNRYYMMARRVKERPIVRKNRRCVYDSWPFSGQQNIELPNVSYFLEKDADTNELYRVPDRSIMRLYKFRLDIIQPSDKLTSCITKAYGSHHIRTSGSLIQTKNIDCREYNWEDTESLVGLGLRFMTPLEIARLHSFPTASYEYPSSMNNEIFNPPTQAPHLQFPEDLSLINKYRLLGNSLNCWVVAELYKHYLFSDEWVNHQQ